MVREKKKSHPLPQRFSAALSEEAYARLRQLNADYGLSNNYLLTVLLENLDAFADSATLDACSAPSSTPMAPPPSAAISKGRPQRDRPLLDDRGRTT